MMNGLADIMSQCMKFQVPIHSLKFNNFSCEGSDLHRLLLRIHCFEVWSIWLQNIVDVFGYADDDLLNADHLQIIYFD